MFIALYVACVVWSTFYITVAILGRNGGHGPTNNLAIFALIFGLTGLIVTYL